MSVDRSAKLHAIAQQVATCTLCALYENAKNPVPGAGNADAEIVFIGEGPGEQEDLQGLPFIGRSGRYLDYLLGLIEMNRDQVFIANVVKHRPPANRDPLPDEIAACAPYLSDQLAVIDPLVIVTLGRFSMARYFPNAKITQVHGQPRFEERLAYFPMFHPAAALRNPGLRADMEADIRRLPSLIEEVRRRRGDSGPIAPLNDGTGSDEDAPPHQLSLF
jgi:DNA polymerase